MRWSGLVVVCGLLGCAAGIGGGEPPALRMRVLGFRREESGRYTLRVQVAAFNPNGHTLTARSLRVSVRFDGRDAGQTESLVWDRPAAGGTPIAYVADVRLFAQGEPYVLPANATSVSYTVHSDVEFVGPRGTFRVSADGPSEVSRAQLEGTESATTSGGASAP